MEKWKTPEDVIRFDPKWVYLTKNLNAGIILSQLLDPDFDIPRVTRGGVEWFVISYKDWLEFCVISRKKAQKALKILEDMGIITRTYGKYNGSRTTHIKLNDTFKETL